MAEKRSSSADETPGEGRFHEIQRELAAKRRAPYRLTQDIVIPPITRRQARQLRVAKDEDAQMAILLGDHHEAVQALYDDRPFDEWIAFQDDFYSYFYGAGAAELPGGSSGS